MGYSRKVGNPKFLLKDYYLSLTTAKEIAMVENNDAGRKIRLYLIRVEEAWNSPEMIMSRALQMSQKTIETYQNRIAGLSWL